MRPCPHCGQLIDADAAAVYQACRYDPGGAKVSLGCGTLILITIIVAVFSGASDSSDEIRELQRDIQALEQKIDALTERQ